MAAQDPADLFQTGTWRWRALYSSILFRRQDPIYEGFLWLDPKGKSIKLVNRIRVVLDSRVIKVRECIHPGSTIDQIGRAHV